MTTTVIVGASAAGLATAACLKRKGSEFVLLEAGDRVGAAWRNHYERLHLHTAKSLSALPFVPFPREAPRYPSRAQVVEYLESYAERLLLAPQFGQRVVSIKRDGEAWTVRTAEVAYQARNVVVATGFTRVPSRPSWPGMAEFAGRILHSSEYRSGKAFAGQRVLVVGFGNSGGEIALDLCEQGARPSLCVRSPVNVIPRDFLGLPILAWGLALSLLPVAAGDAVARAVSRIRFGRLDAVGLRKLPYGPMRQIREHGRIPLLDVGTIARIRRGEIEVLPEIESFTRNGARFRTGERHFDAVVLATGYRPAVGEIVDAPGALDARGTPLRSGEETLPGLYFCGFNVVATGMLREISREAGRIANSIANH
ncbi:MAG: flavin-containing monooxygenase [Myxococcales bacterium]